MTVTEISAAPDRRGRYRVCFSGGEVMKLSPALIADHGLYTGGTVDQKLIDLMAEEAAKKLGESTISTPVPMETPAP